MPNQEISFDTTNQRGTDHGISDDGKVQGSKHQFTDGTKQLAHRRTSLNASLPSIPTNEEIAALEQQQKQNPAPTHNQPTHIHEQSLDDVLPPLPPENEPPLAVGNVPEEGPSPTDALAREKSRALTKLTGDANNEGLAVKLVNANVMTEDKAKAFQDALRDCITSATEVSELKSLDIANLNINEQLVAHAKGAAAVKARGKMNKHDKKELTNLVANLAPNHDGKQIDAQKLLAFIGNDLKKSQATIKKTLKKDFHLKSEQIDEFLKSRNEKSFPELEKKLENLTNDKKLKSKVVSRRSRTRTVDNLNKELFPGDVANNSKKNVGHKEGVGVKTKIAQRFRELKRNFQLIKSRNKNKSKNEAEKVLKQLNLTKSEIKEFFKHGTVFSRYGNDFEQLKKDLTEIVRDENKKGNAVGKGLGKSLHRTDRLVEMLEAGVGARNNKLMGFSKRPLEEVVEAIDKKNLNQVEGGEDEYDGEELYRGKLDERGILTYAEGDSTSTGNTTTSPALGQERDKSVQNVDDDGPYENVTEGTPTTTLDQQLDKQIDAMFNSPNKPKEQQ